MAQYSLLLPSSACISDQGPPWLCECPQAFWVPVGSQVSTSPALCWGSALSEGKECAAFPKPADHQISSSITNTLDSLQGFGNCTSVLVLNIPGLHLATVIFLIPEEESLCLQRSTAVVTSGLYYSTLSNYKLHSYCRLRNPKRLMRIVTSLRVSYSYILPASIKNTKI